MLKESIKMSLQNIKSNKMRSFLTTLGIVIGVASIIALITIVQGATDSITSTISSMGANKITIQAKGTAIKQGLNQYDIEKLGKLDNIQATSPTINGTVNLVYNKKVIEKISIQGKNEVYFENTDDLVKTGRSINIIDCKSKNKVCLIGENIAHDLFYGENPLDKTIKLNGASYKIIGILSSSASFSASSNNDLVIIPYTTAMSFIGTGYINTVDVYMKDTDEAQDTSNKIETFLFASFNYKDNAFSVMNMGSLIDRIGEMTSTLSLMLGGIASISLIVGGIGIMNMMLVSVTERTTEIGLRKALGAKPKRIQQQFLLESVFLSLIGGIIGLILGISIAYLVCSIMGSAFSLNIWTILLAISFSSAIGIIFGLTPAKKASKLNPIDALRSV